MDELLEALQRALAAQLLHKPGEDYPSAVERFEDIFNEYIDKRVEERIDRLRVG